MTTRSIEELRREVERRPRDAGPRLRLGAALLESGETAEAASQLLLASRMEPANVQVALIATDALVRSGKSRDAALHLSTRVHNQTAFARLAPAEQELLETLLRHPDRYVRSHTARALGRLKIVACLEALEQASDDPDATVRLAASGALRVLRAH